MPRHVLHRVERGGCLLAAVVLLACGSDGPELILAPGTEVASAYDDGTIAAQVTAADQLPTPVPRTTAFVDGEQTHYWHFGEWSTAPMPAFLLCRDLGPGRCEPVGHPIVVDAVPGDEGYSPFEQVFEVPVSADYDGEVLPSRRAIDLAVSRGLVNAPRALPAIMHCPVVGPGVLVEVGPGETREADGTFYYRGRSVPCVDFTPGMGLRGLTDGLVLVRNVYVLRRESEDNPLVEDAWGEDLTADGDTSDTNNIFSVSLDDADYTPLWRVVMVTVADDFRGIDTSLDDSVSDYSDSEQIFTTDAMYDITPVEGAIVEHELTETLIDCPLQSTPGGF